MLVYYLGNSLNVGLLSWKLEDLNVGLLSWKQFSRERDFSHNRNSDN